MCTDMNSKMDSSRPAARQSTGCMHAAAEMYLLTPSDSIFMANSQQTKAKTRKQQQQQQQQQHTHTQTHTPAAATVALDAYCCGNACLTSICVEMHFGHRYGTRVLRKTKKSVRACCLGNYAHITCTNMVSRTHPGQHGGHEVHVVMVVLLQQVHVQVLQHQVRLLHETIVNLNKTRTPFTGLQTTAVLFIKTNNTRCRTERSLRLQYIRSAQAYISIQD